MICTIYRQCPLPVVHAIPVEIESCGETAQTNLIPSSVVSLWHCHGYTEYASQLRTCWTTHICAVQTSHRPVWGMVMGMDVVRIEILTEIGIANAMRWPYSTLTNTISFLIQDTILPRGRRIIMCLHICRYGINSCIPFDVKDLHYLANSCGACCLMYGHTAYSADSGRWENCWSDCVDFMAYSVRYHWWGWSSVLLVTKLSGVLWRKTL